MLDFSGDAWAREIKQATNSTVRGDGDWKDEEAWMRLIARGLLDEPYFSLTSPKTGMRHMLGFPLPGGLISLAELFVSGLLFSSNVFSRLMAGMPSITISWPLSVSLPLSLSGHIWRIL